MYHTQFSGSLHTDWCVTQYGVLCAHLDMAQGWKPLSATPQVEIKSLRARLQLAIWSEQILFKAKLFEG